MLLLKKYLPKVASQFKIVLKMPGVYTAWITEDIFFLDGEALEISNYCNFLKKKNYS